MVFHSIKDLAKQWLRMAFGAYVRSSAGKGHYEVELKFRLTEPEAKSLTQKFEDHGFKYTATVRLADTFLPNAVDGEMMRVRRATEGESRPYTLLTFKQWVKTSSGRTRKEAERAAPSTVALLWLLIGRYINGEPLLGFDKERQLYEGSLGASECVASIDNVNGLGEFSGWYMEVETLVPLDQDPAAFEKPILDLVEKVLGERRQPVKHSYREMLIQSRQAA